VSSSTPSDQTRWLFSSSWVFYVLYFVLEGVLYLLWACPLTYSKWVSTQSPDKQFVESLLYPILTVVVYYVLCNWRNARFESSASQSAVPCTSCSSTVVCWKTTGISGGSRHSARVAKTCGGSTDIRLGGQFNMFPSISRLFLRWGAKVCSQTGWGPWPDNPALDLPLAKNHLTNSTRARWHESQWNYLRSNNSSS